MIDLAALDIAGTTVEEGGAVYRALHDAVRRHGSAADVADVARWMGADKRTAIRALLELGGDTSAVEPAFVDFEKLLREAYDTTPPAPMPGVLDAFTALRDHGVRIVLTTGFSADVTGLLLDRLGWADGLLDAVVTTDDVPSGRPAPYMVHRAMERTGVTDVARVLTVGDTVLDLEAGTNAGAGLVVGVLSGGVPRAVLEAAPHTHVVDSVADVPALLRG
ncbi:phosphonatase-like hydrolase [Isoptericola dokdonensis]|uniref:Phosphonoacetaldehyde hydrolase n=1 Tax=Isoptericola dokdonensis DS-3 TaxID=1300344 RepID=A0A168ETH4_9MICO|nr:phosphonatase-like hydrolase [Isoptericola dokdonensis]ANC30456.1 Phosphonoacetaldehyde hydrolase [Isoptericola dokdonensis DS-3]